MRRLPIIVLLNLLAACSNPEKKISQQTTPSEEEQLKAAIRQYPDSLLLVETLIQWYRDNGNTERAIREVDSLLKQDHSLANFWHIRAVLFFEQADTLQAIRSLEQASRLEPQPSFLESLGTLYAETGNIKALETADSLQAVEPPKWDKESWYIKGLYYSSIHQENKAIEWFDKSLSISFTYMEAYREKAIALMHLNRYADALAVLDKAVTLQNGFDEGHYYRGQCLEKLNRLQEAIEAYETALMYDSGYTEARDAWRRLRKITGNNEP